MGLTRRDLAKALLAGAVCALAPGHAVANRGARAARSRPSIVHKTQARAARLISQSDLRGGHFKRRHVAKPLSYLKARASAPKLRRAFKTAVAGRPVPSQAARARVARHLKNAPGRARRREFSTFATEQAAQAALARALARNDGRLRAWLKGGGQRLTLQTAVPGSSGAVYLPGSGRTVQPKKAIFVLAREGRSFRLHTGYLSSTGSSGH